MAGASTFSYAPAFRERGQGLAMPTMIDPKMDLEPVNLKKKIQVRLEEKRKLYSARKGYFILLMVANGLVMATFLRVSFLHHLQAIPVPVAYLASAAITVLLAAVVWKAWTYGRQDELPAVTVYLKVALVMVVLLVLMLVSGAVEILAEMEEPRHSSFAALAVFLSFYTINLLFMAGALFIVLKKVKLYEIHSKNMADVNRLLVLSVFLSMTFALFVLLAG